jgi:ankyrin repeat protein
MPARHLPVRPDLDQLRHQAKDLLRAIRRSEPEALADLEQYHPQEIAPESAKLADAQLVLARSYQAPSWPRLVVACRLTDAIWRDDVETVRALVTLDPRLLHESALVRESNWGPPLSYAANLGRDRIIKMLRELGAADLEHAMDRAVLQGRIDTARMLHDMLGRPRPPRGALGSPAYTLSASGTAFLFEIGAEVYDADGENLAPVGTVLQTDSRKPDAKHQILEMYVAHGLRLPDTPVMALHRGRTDLLEQHLQRDPALLGRTFRYEEILPPELGCHEQRLPGTTLEGATLLHVCVEFDELEIARWLLERGMSPDAPAAVDAAGFGGHTALFGAVVSYPNFWMNYAGGWARDRKPEDPRFARLLLDAGADPNARASLRERVMEGNPYVLREVREHRDLTPLAWGSVFHNRMIVSEPAMRLVAERGGQE